MERKGGGARPRRTTGAAAGGGVFRRGAGRGTGPVGQSDGYAGRRASRGSGGATPPGGFYPPGGTGGTGSGFSSGARAAGAPYIRRLLPLLILLIAGYFIIKSCGLIGGPAEELLPTTVRTDVSSTTARWTTAPTITGNPANNDIDASTGITGPRTPRTVIRGNGQDTVTLMVYMCGTDLESESGMATADLNEMLYADVGDHVNIIVETGGTTRWRNSVIRNDTNQRYRVTDTGLEPLEEDLGRRAMTDPDTLRDFVSYCAERYPANRYALIFWDHGGGTLGGYGYDQVFPGEGAMSIGEIDSALESAGVTFDFVGFDACLMATLETAYMMNYHADYLIASEETEPGIGWYYTDWITALSADPSMPTSEIGRRIIDSFVETCGKNAPRDTATLSILDLVALNNTGDKAFRDFATASGAQLDQDYKLISDARGAAREFNKAKLDQVDLIDLAQHIDSSASRALVDALRQVVLYNRTSANASRANGVSIYFPYDELRNLSSMLSEYDRIGMGAEYTGLIRKFANMVVGGQITTSGSDNAFGALTGGTGGSPSLPAGDLWAAAWQAFFSNADYGRYTGDTAGGVDWIDEAQIKAGADYYRDRYLDADALVLTTKGDGQVLRLTDAQWDLVQSVDVNLFYDDGEGYIDLGIDSIAEFDADGDLAVGFDGTWIALDNHVVAYYVTRSDLDSAFWSIEGRVPALLNGRRVDIILTFDRDHPYGVVAGARTDYQGATDTVAKGLTDIVAGDVIDFLCDFYSYDEVYEDSYLLGEPMTADGELEVSNVDIGEAGGLVTCRLTDLYNNTYWTPAVEWNP